MTFSSRALRDPPRAIAAGFFVLALAWAALGRAASDEGTLTWFASALLGESFAAGLFLQRFHPALGLLYLPTLPFGWGGFVVAHVAVASLGVLAAGRWMQRAGGDGALAALALAASPAYLYGAVTGQSNTDGAALLLVGCALYEGDGGRARFAGGAVLGFTVWARYELAPAVAALALYALWRKERRAAFAGVLLWPVGYLAAGAVYHRMGLWFVRYPPLDTLSAPGIQEAFRLRPSPEAARRLALAPALVSGAWALMAAGGARGALASTRIIAGVTGSLGALFVALPFFGTFGPEVVPRYLSVALPAVAVAGGALATLNPRSLGPAVALALTAAAAWIGARAGGTSALLLSAPLSAAWCALGVARPSVRRLALGVALSLPLLTALPSPQDLARFEAPWAPVALADRVADLARARPPRTVVTNVQNLAPLLAARGSFRVRYLLGFDVAMALPEVTHPSNGQLQAVARAFSARYERTGALWPCGLARETFYPGDLVVLGAEWRTEPLTPSSMWRPFTERVADLDHTVILRVTRGPSRVTLPPPPWARARGLGALCGN
ncbi:MAG: hypothetical protein R3A48_25755 [Polyangiales bacterium]